MGLLWAHDMGMAGTRALSRWKRNDRFPFFGHGLLSPPQVGPFAEGADQLEAVGALFVSAKVIARAHQVGPVGGAIIPHLWRRGELGRPDRWGPHVHVLGTPLDVLDPEGALVEGGWVVKMARARDSGSPHFGRKGLPPRLAYALDHVSLVPGRRPFDLFGGALQLAFKELSLDCAAPAPTTDRAGSALSRPRRKRPEKVAP
ncbi:MAG: hypothetical protein KGI98_15330 [Euryarchaeota archaeon]|nr:hypothetical protein [Euryarchaeota archaeon]